MDLWKDEDPTQSAHPNDTSSISYIWDILPHITKRKTRQITTIPSVFSMIEEDKEEEDQNNHSRTDAQNIYASIAARHVGTQIPKSQESDIRLRKGRL